MTGVIGWFSANPRSTRGIVSTGESTAQVGRNSTTKPNDDEADFGFGLHTVLEGVERLIAGHAAARPA